MKKTKRRREIVDTWNRIEADDPNISTERLFAMVEDETGADAGEITDALITILELKEKNGGI